MSFTALNQMASFGGYDKVVDWWRGQDIKTYEDYLEVLDNFKIVFACNSNQIEGSHITYHTTRDIFEGNDIKNFTGSYVEVMQTANQKFAFEFMIKSLTEHKTISVDFVKKLHKIMLNGCYDEKRYNRGERPGKFKIHDYCVGIGSEGSYPEEVESDITELVDELNDIDVSSMSNVLKAAAYFHLKFESIHPFADGNGRVGRALLNYFLMYYNHPPIVLFNEDRDTYYLALEVWDRTCQLDGFVKFLKEEITKTWSRKITNI